jgi:type I restriction enzyme, R subunit
VISPDNNDDPVWSEWTDAARIESRIARFKKPLLHRDPDKADPLAFLIVKSMLLTGFDAPIEGVMYLDRPIREAELLQAIARVNRTGMERLRGSWSTIMASPAT